MRAKRHSDPLKFITRMEGELCWKLQLSASSSRNGTAVQLYFGDAKHGGRDLALQEAQKTREALRDHERAYGHRKSTVKTREKLLPAGVTRFVERRLDGQGNPRYDLIWAAYWMVPIEGGRLRQARKRYSARAHGYGTAFMLARNLRAEKSGFDIWLHPCPDIWDVLQNLLLQNNGLRRICTVFPFIPVIPLLRDEDDAQLIISHLMVMGALDPSLALNRRRGRRSSK